MLKTQIKCPTCHKTMFMNLSPKSLKINERGLTSIQINPGQLCSHKFVIYIDPDFRLRDYYKLDFVLKTYYSPKKAYNFDLDIIKYNLTSLKYILRSSFFNKRTVLILERRSLYAHIVNFLKYLLQKTFGIKLIIISKKSFERNCDRFNDCVVIDGSTVIVDKDNVIKHNKLKVESHLSEGFFKDKTNGLILLKNEIQRIYNLSYEIVKIRKNEEFKGTTDIFNKVKHKYNKMSGSYFNFLTLVVNEYFNVKLPGPSETFMNFVLKN